MSSPAGWYDDPEDPTQQRYWDGSTWTDQRRAQQGPTPYQGQFGQGSAPGTPPQYGQPMQHGQVFGGGQQGPGQYPQYGQQEPPPQYGVRVPQYGQQVPQYGAGPHQQQPGYGQGYGQGYGYPGKRAATTPDGQPLSGWWRRVWARVLDGLLAGLIGLPLTGYFYVQYFHALMKYFDDTVNASADGTPPSAFTLPGEVYQWMFPILGISLLVSFVYEYLFLTKKGATPGKMALGIAVRLRDHPGNPPGSAVLKRYGLYMGLSVLSAIPLVGTLFSFVSLINGLWPLWDERNQALHDKVAATNVVRT